MKLISDSKIEKQSLSSMYFGGLASSDFKLGFIIGSKWTQRRIEPMFVEFENFCEKTRSMDHVIAMDEQASTGSMPFTRHRTTEELFELWMEEQTKK